MGTGHMARQQLALNAIQTSENLEVVPPSKSDLQRVQKTLYLPKPLNNTLRVYAAEQDIQQSAVVVEALTDYFAKKKRKIR